MRSKNSVDPARIENLNRSIQIAIELNNEERVLARCGLDKNIDLVRASSDVRILMGDIRNEQLRKALYVDDDYPLAKKLCYDMAKLIEVMHYAHHSDLTAVLAPDIDRHLNASFVLFSDHRPLIQKFLNFDYAMYGDTEEDLITRQRQIERGGALYAYAMYSLANGDFERVAYCTELARQRHNKSQSSKAAKAHLNLHIAIWQAIVQRDKTSLAKHILDLIRKAHWFFNPQADFDGYFISSPAVGYLKAAWLLGMEVEVDHKYIPMEMMPYQPLPAYEKRYWFLLDD